MKTALSLFSSVGLVCCLVCCLICGLEQVRAADEVPPSTAVTATPKGGYQGPKDYGFFYEAESKRYFTNGRSSFLIRPVRDKEYLERIEISVDEQDFMPYVGKLSFAKEGPHLIRFRASDPVLNWSPIQSFNVHVDMTPPKSEPQWKGPNFYKGAEFYVHPSTSLGMNTQDALSGVSKILWQIEDKTVGVFP